MSQANVELVRRAVEAINRRDADALLAESDPDLTQDWSRAIGPDSGVFRGHDQVRKFLQSWWDAFAETSLELDELFDAGDQVVTVVHTRNRGRGSGLELEGPTASLVWRLRDGKIVSTTLHQTRAEALGAVGLSG